MSNSSFSQTQGFSAEPSFKSYEEIKKDKEEKMDDLAGEPVKLNEAHDTWISETVTLAVHHHQSERGELPAHFAFFLMGSAGRQEQAKFSDQDHGIVFEGTDDEHQDYFLGLGAEIREGMAIVGYPRCEGLVMASHKRWCHGVEGWKKQVDGWIEADEWGPFRHLLTFIDARTLLGKDELLEEVKEHVFEQAGRGDVLKRLSENTAYLHKGLNAFGQLLPEEKGQYAGSMHIKDVGFFPYVHALRLLAIYEGIHASSTIERIRQVSEKHSYVKGKDVHFKNLLELRASFSGKQNVYEDVHYVPVQQLSKNQKAELKSALKEGKHLFQHTKKIMESGDF